MVKGLLERLRDGETLVVAEGYLLEFQARGYLQHGSWVPEVVLEHPELVEGLHREFVHAGSDVVMAFTFHAHREKMRVLGREDDLETINTRALSIARKVADESGTLMAGDITTTNLFDPNNDKLKDEVYSMFEEQVKWAVKGGADFIVGETFQLLGEARLALKAIKEFGEGLPAVITLANLRSHDYEGLTLAAACKLLEEEGADVIGINCAQGPKTMIPLLKQIKGACKGPVAGLPVTYRTNDKYPEWASLPDLDNPEKSAYPIGLDAWLCPVNHIEDFAREAKYAGIQYLGLCCGNRPHYTRSLAETVGKTPPASRYAPDMSKHYTQIGDERYKFAQSRFVEVFDIQK